MKRLGFMVGVIVLLQCFAFPADSKELRFDLGLRTWYNKWQVEAFNDTESDYTFLVGPNFKLSYGNFFGGLSYMTNAGDYRFPDSEWSRHDLDVIFGYMVHPRLGVVGGFKYLRGKGSTGNSHSEYGPVLGLTFNYPLPIDNTGLIFYANGFFISMQGEYKIPGVSTPDYDIIGYSGEAGFAYEAFENFSINLGYKHQFLKWKDLANDILSGIILGVSYGF
jgi:hypothetical protein